MQHLREISILQGCIFRMYVFVWLMLTLIPIAYLFLMGSFSHVPSRSCSTSRNFSIRNYQVYYILYWVLVTIEKPVVGYCRKKKEKLNQNQSRGSVFEMPLKEYDENIEKG